MIRKRILGVVAVGGLVLGTLAVSVPAGADLDAGTAGNQLVSCTGMTTITKLNPAITDGATAAYTKGNIKASDGTKVDLLGNPVPADATSCDIDLGIRTDQPGQSVKYTLDTQATTSPLTVTGGSGLYAAKGKFAGHFSGSSSCVTANNTYTTDGSNGAYPLQGKLIFKFQQADMKGKQAQMQQYFRAGAFDNPLNPAEQRLTVTGMVIKGPGIGGDVSATISFFPTNFKKNTDPFACVGLDDPAVPTALSELIITQSPNGTDGSGNPTGPVDPWKVSIPS